MRGWLVLLVSLASSTLVRAQSPELNPVAPPEKVDETRRVSALFGDCIVKMHHAAAQEFLLQDLQITEANLRADKAVRQVTDPACLEGAAAHDDMGLQLGFPGDTLRYDIADALFRAELLAASPINDVDRRANLTRTPLNEAEYQPQPGKTFNPRQLAEAQEARAGKVATIAMSELGECVVRQNPVAAFALLQTKPVSPAENAAFARVAESAANCMMKGANLRLSKTALRGTVAVNYYRLARSPRLPLQSVEKR